MKLFSFDFLRRKPKEQKDSNYSSVVGIGPSIASQPSQFSSSSGMTNEFAAQENMRAKLDLMLTQMDSMRIQHDSMSERIVQIEKIVKQLLDMSKS